MNLSKLAADNIIPLLENFKAFKDQATTQDDGQMTPAPKFKHSDTFLDFQSEDCLQILRRFKALHGTNFTGVRSKYSDRIFFIEDMTLVTEEEYALYLAKYENAKPGSLWLIFNKKYKNFVYIKCKEGWIRMNAWRPVDKKTREAFKFIDEYLDKKQQDKLSEG